MIEQGIYFALGCIVTALLSLLFAPVFWRRALRLTRQRLQLQVPMSMQEILVERDQLRAEFAIERLRIEQAMERVQDGKAADMALIGRQAMAAAALAEEHEALKKLEAAQQSELDLFRQESSRHGAERDRTEQMRADHERLQEELESHRTTIASLKTRSMGLEMRLTDAERARIAREKQLEETLRARLETAMSQSTRHETANISLRRELDDAKAHIRALEEQSAAIGETARAQSSRKDEIGKTDDEGLRTSIHALGVAVADLMRRQEAENAKPARHLASREEARKISVS